MVTRHGGYGFIDEIRSGEAAKREITELYEEDYARVPAPTRPSRWAWMVYVGLFAVIPFVIAFAVLAQTGLLTPTQTTTRAPWDLAAIVFSLVVTVAMSVVVSRNALFREEGALFPGERRLGPGEVAVVIASLPLAGVLLLAALFAYARVLVSVGPFTLGPLAPPILAASGLLVAISPFAFLMNRDERRVRRLEDRFPDFLRDLNESYSAGLTISQAIEASSRGDYGELNPDIQRMANQVSWGTPFQEALSMFAAHVGTPLVKRAAGLIVKATEAGGNVRDVLAAATRDAREIRALDRERRLNMALYVGVIYISFAVFLAVTGALQGLFVPAILHVSETGRGVDFGTLSVSHRLGYADFRFIYFDVGLVQGIGSGVVAGYMAEGSLSAGLKHAAVMVATSVLVLGFLL